MVAAESQKTGMEVRDYDIDFLFQRFRSDNPQRQTRDKFRRLAASIERRGALIPGAFNLRTERVFSGEHRIRAARSAGLKSYPMAVLDISEAEESTLLIALNKIDGNWDLDKLPQQLERILLKTAEDPDLEVDLGMSQDRILLLASQDDVDLEDPDAESNSQTSFSKFVNNSRSKLGSADRPVVFRSPRCKFSCPQSEYDEFASQLDAQFGATNIPEQSRYVADLIGISKYLPS